MLSVYLCTLCWHRQRQMSTNERDPSVVGLLGSSCLCKRCLSSLCCSEKWCRKIWIYWAKTISKHCVIFDIFLRFLFLFQPSQLSAGGDSSKSGGGVIVVDAAAMKEAEATAAAAAQQPTVAYIKVSYVIHLPPHSIIPLKATHGGSCVFHAECS